MRNWHFVKMISEILLLDMLPYEEQKGDKAELLFFAMLRDGVSDDIYRCSN